MNRTQTLERAIQVVMRDREAVHGNPGDTFAKIAMIWTAILGHDVDPSQVALCLAGLKLARLAGNPSHSDSWVDLAGYAACGAEMSTNPSDTGAIA